MAIVALLMMALLPLLMHRHLHHCQTSIIALVSRCPGGLVALIVMALLPSMHRHICHHSNFDCCPHDNGVLAVVDAQASLTLLSCHCCPHNHGVVILDLQWRCCPCCNGVVTILKLASLPLLQWHCCHHQCHHPHC